MSKKRVVAFERMGAMSAWRTSGRAAIIDASTGILKIECIECITGEISANTGLSYK